MSTAIFKNIHCNIGENLLQQREKAIATSQALLMQHFRKTTVPKQNPLRHRGETAATNEKSYCTISRTTPATSEKRLLQQQKKYHCNIPNHPLQH
jgi:hypothetical protein